MNANEILREAGQVMDTTRTKKYDLSDERLIVVAGDPRARLLAIDRGHFGHYETEIELCGIIFITITQLPLGFLTVAGRCIRARDDGSGRPFTR
jgi:hypothetical protein